MTPPVVYVAGPYRAESSVERLENVRRAWAYARSLWTRGVAAVCPHANTYEMDGPDLDVEVLLAGDFEILRRCDVVHVLPGWEGSEGTRLEIAVARAAGVPVVFVSELE